MHEAIGLSPLVSVERLWRQINSFLLAESYAFARTSQLNAHPGTFRLKNDPKGALQYGLIAEEVAKVYPELVLRNASGRIDGVRYDELAPMLLNEVQQQQRGSMLRRTSMRPRQLNCATCNRSKEICRWR
jgi:hypothetical protein